MALLYFSLFPVNRSVRIFRHSGALVAATTGAHIRVSEGNYNETPLLDQSRILTLSGSWNAAFSTQTSNLTRIRSLQVTMGTLHVQEMCIGP